MDARGRVENTVCLILILCAFAAASALTNKAFFCRDPDTGKLYPVNSTWLSSSFCGKYTCKLRKKSNNSPSQTNTLPNKYYEKIKTPLSKKGELSKNCSEPVGVIVEDEVTSNKYVNSEKFKKLDNVKNVELAAKTSDGDRYLTEEEVTALSLLLQTMKKSDLEAILEVYNLAQDIYKEIDKVTEEKLNASNAQDNKDSPKNKNPVDNEIPDDIKNKKIISYWYEPLAPVNSKLKAGEFIEKLQEQAYVKSPRIKPHPDNTIPKSLYEGLNLVEGVTQKNKLFESVPKTRIHDKPYVEAPLVSADFRKLPYYHPITNFQKQASYVRPTNIYSQLNSVPISFSKQQQLFVQPAIYPQPLLELQQYNPLPLYPQLDKEEFVQQKRDKNTIPLYSQKHKVASSESREHHGKCCKHHQQDPSIRFIPWRKTMEDSKKPANNKKYDDRRLPDKIYDSKTSIPYSESKINPNFDLSMEYLHNYNNVSSIQPFNLESTWELLGLSDKARRRSKPAAYSGAPFLAQAPNKLTVSSEESPDVNDKEQEQVQNAKNETPDLPDWQTGELPISVLNEVKANIATSKFLPFPFRKKVRLERIGKLLKIDEAGRVKREAVIPVQENKEVIVPEEYEVYIEKSTCETDIEPGFFRMGNASETFPACCPQRIRS